MPRIPRAWLPCVLLACLACARDAERAAPAVAAAPPPEFNAGLHWSAASARADTTSFTLLATRDDKRKPFHGAVSYRLRLPADIPARRAWSIVVRDASSHALVGTERPQLSSREARANPDGSIDIFIGPNPPDREDANWLATDPHFKFELSFRFEAPTPPLFARTWKLPNVERVPACQVCKMKRRNG